MYVGSFFVEHEVNNDAMDRSYSSGDILSCFFGLVFGIFALGMAGPNFKSIAEGQVAGKLAFDIIERKPDVLIDGNQSKQELKGEIEFRKVTFRYPSRKDQKVLREFSSTF